MNRIEPPWWWKPWLTPWFAIHDWWHRERPVREYARRDKVIGWLANQLLRLASKRYQAMIKGSIKYGLAAAATCPFPWFSCGCGQPLLPDVTHTCGEAP